MDVFEQRRREPRVHLRMRVLIEGTSEDRVYSYETTTVDLSPHGASVLVDESVPLGTVIEFAAMNYPFRTTATVRSVTRDTYSGKTVLGLEFPEDQQNPILIWSSKKRNDRPERDSHFDLPKAI